MKNILKIGLKSKKAFEHLKKVDHKKINKTFTKNYNAINNVKKIGNVYLINLDFIKIIVDILV